MSSRISRGRWRKAGRWRGRAGSDGVMGEGSVGSDGDGNGYGFRAYSWRERKYSRRACLGRAHTSSSGRWMMDWMLRAGLDFGNDAVREDVQIRLVGGTGTRTGEEFGRLARLSDVMMFLILGGEEQHGSEGRGFRIARLGYRTSSWQCNAMHAREIIR